MMGVGFGPCRPKGPMHACMLTRRAHEGEPAQPPDVPPTWRRAAAARWQCLDRLRLLQQVPRWLAGRGPGAAWRGQTATQVGKGKRGHVW